MAKRYELDGKVVFITGAARGIGAEAARQLTAKGAKVALTGLEPEMLERLATELGPERAAWFEADVTDLGALERAAAGTVERFGGIDVAIANAGVAPSSPLGVIDPVLFDRVIEVNLGGVYRTIRATYPHVTARAGYFLPIASLAAALHSPMLGPYAASKAAVEALGNTLRQEVAHTGARVGVAYFSFIDTDMVRRGLATQSAKRSQKLLGPIARTAPVEAVGAALVRGIERRSRQIGVPGWVLGAARARTLLQPLSEHAVRLRGIGDIVEAARDDPQTLTTEQPDGVGRG